MADATGVVVPPINTPWFLDKSLWLAALGFLLPILNKKFSLGLEAGDIYAALSPLIGYIAMNKWKTAKLTSEAMKMQQALVAGQAASVAPADPAKVLNQ